MIQTSVSVDIVDMSSSLNYAAMVPPAVLLLHSRSFSSSFGCSEFATPLTMKTRSTMKQYSSWIFLSSMLRWLNNYPLDLLADADANDD